MIDDVDGRAMVILLVVGAIMSTGVVAAASLTVDSGVTYETGNGFEVTTGTQFSSSFSNPFSGSDTVTLNNVTFSATGDADLTVDQYTGAYTNLSSVAPNSTTITVNPNDKPAVDITGGVTALDFASPALGDGQAEFRYSASSSGTVTIDGLAANTDFGAVTASGSILDGGTTTAGGEATINVPSNTDTRVLLIEPAAPEIDEATASPTGQISGGSVTFEIDVSDADFADGESLDVEFYADGNKIGTDTLATNGTASVTSTISDGGAIPWHVEVTDTYSLTAVSDSDPAASGDQDFEINVPAQLKIRNVTDPKQAVTGANLTVTFFADNDVVSRSDADNDGNISFAGLPLDERFEAQISGDGYASRTIVIPSLFEQQTAYILPDSRTTIRPRFKIDSAIEEFDEANSVIIIERPVNVSGTLQYKTITSAAPGINGYDITLEKNQRYRITIRAPSGANRQKGSYTATASEVVTLQIQGGDFDAVDRQQGTVFAPRWQAGPSPSIAVSVRDPNIQTASVTITRRNDSTTIFSDSSSGNLSVSTPAVNETQYNVSMTATLQNGRVVSDSEQISSGKIPAGSAIDDKWQQLIAMAILLVVAGLFTRANAGIGAIATASIGGIFWFVGWMGGVATGLSVVVALLIGVLAYAKQKRGGVPT